MHHYNLFSSRSIISPLPIECNNDNHDNPTWHQLLHRGNPFLFAGESDGVIKADNFLSGLFRCYATAGREIKLGDISPCGDQSVGPLGRYKVVPKMKVVDGNLMQKGPVDQPRDT